jgi:hypothetical protein
LKKKTDEKALSQGEADKKSTAGQADSGSVKNNRG